MSETLRIVRLEASNFKRLAAVEIEPDPDGNLVLVSGANGAGKTSVLDAIMVALGGAGAASDMPRPVRDGEERAQITVDLGDMVVTRTFTTEGRTKLTVESADGARYPSPQKLLDSFIGRLSFDPLAFTRQKPKEQVATLLGLIDLPFDLDQLNAERDEVYTERRDTNRDVAALKARYAALPVPPADLPAEIVPMADLVAQISDANAQRAHADELARAADRAASALNEAAARVSQLERDLAAARQDLDAASAADLAAAQALADAPAPPDVSLIEAQMATIEATNEQVRAAQEREELAARCRLLEDASQRLTDQLNQVDEKKEAAIRAAAMPIDGLGFDDDGLIYKGIPFTQCSAAEQLRVSLAMGMAANPKVRVILITDGSLLDSTSLALIDEMAGERGFQVWTEIVDETGQVGVVIEDGRVAP